MSKRKKGRPGTCRCLRSKVEESQRVLELAVKEGFFDGCLLQPVPVERVTMTMGAHTWSTPGGTIVPTYTKPERSATRMKLLEAVEGLLAGAYPTVRIRVTRNNVRGALAVGPFRLHLENRKKGPCASCT